MKTLIVKGFQELRKVELKLSLTIQMHYYPLSN